MACAVQSVFDDLEGFTFRTEPQGSAADKGYDAILQASSAEVEFEIGINAKARITPQTAWSVVEQMQRLPAEMLRVAYAPVISPRVAEILDKYGVGYVDEAGNCRLRSARHRLLIDRRGRMPRGGCPKGPLIRSRPSRAASSGPC